MDGDEPGEMGPRIDMDAPLPPQVPHQFAIHDAEVEAELVPHLVPPLDLQRRRADDQDSAGPVADDEFQIDHPGFDGLAQAHVVSNQQVDPRHLDRPHHRVKLVVFDVDARAEWRLDRFYVGGRGCPPANRIEKGVEPGGASKPVGSGRATFSMTCAPGSNSQMTCNSSPRPSSSTEDKRDQMLGPVARNLQRSIGQRAFCYLLHDVAMLPNRDQLALFRRIACGDGHLDSPSLAPLARRRLATNESTSPHRTVPNQRPRIAATAPVDSPLDKRNRHSTTLGGRFKQLAVYKFHPPIELVLDGQSPRSAVSNRC